MCLFGNNNIFIGNKNGDLNLIDLRYNKNMKINGSHSNSILAIKKIKFASKLGFKIFTQGFGNEIINMWG